MFLSNTDELVDATREHFCRVPTNKQTLSLSIFVDEGKLKIICIFINYLIQRDKNSYK